MLTKLSFRDYLNVRTSNVGIQFYYISLMFNGVSIAKCYSVILILNTNTNSNTVILILNKYTIKFFQ